MIPEEVWLDLLILFAGHQQWSLFYYRRNPQIYWLIQKVGHTIDNFSQLFHEASFLPSWKILSDQTHRHLLCLHKLGGPCSVDELIYNDTLFRVQFFV